MTVQGVLMLLVFVICVISAIDWWIRGELETGWAFFFFGCGDACLALEFMSASAAKTLGG